MRYHTTDQGEVKPCRVTTGKCRYESDSVHLEFADAGEARLFGEQVLEVLYSSDSPATEPISKESMARAKIKALAAFIAELDRREDVAREAALKASAVYSIDQTEAKERAVLKANGRLQDLTDRNLELKGSVKDLIYGYLSEEVPSVGKVGAKDALGLRGDRPQLKDDEMFVYRVELPSGRGPYAIKGVELELRWSDDGTIGGMLSPQTDGINRIETEDLYGFENFDQLNAYFSQDALRILGEFSTEEEPLQISEYIVEKNSAQVGGSQLVFNLFSARGSRAMLLEDHKGEPDSVRKKLQESLRTR